MYVLTCKSDAGINWKELWPRQWPVRRKLSALDLHCTISQSPYAYEDKHKFLYFQFSATPPTFFFFFFSLFLICTKHCDNEALIGICLWIWGLQWLLSLGAQRNRSYVRKRIPVGLSDCRWSKSERMVKESLDDPFGKHHREQCCHERTMLICHGLPLFWHVNMPGDVDHVPRKTFFFFFFFLSCILRRKHL